MSLPLRHAPRRPCTHHGCVWLGPLADRAKRARRRGRFDACVRPVLFDRRAGARQGRSAVGNRLTLRVRAAICARVSLGSTASAPTKSHPAALASRYQQPNCYQPSSLAKKRRWRACPPLACGAHTDARARTPRVSREISRLARALRRDSHTQDPRPARRQDHETSRGQRIQGRRAWVRGPRIPGWPRFRRPAAAGEAEAASTKDLGYGRGCVPLFLLRFPRARLDRSADASSDALTIAVHLHPQKADDV